MAQRIHTLIVLGLDLLLAVGCYVPSDAPLTKAAGSGDTARVASLIVAGADVNETNDRGLTPLIAAARGGHIETIGALLKLGADPDRRGGVNDWTPLMHAIHKDQEMSVLSLLNGGANVDARLRNGTALMMAAGYGYTAIVRDLLAHGADPFIEGLGGHTALTLAVSGMPDIDRFTLTRCQTETVKALLDHAPQLALKGTKSLRTARFFARLGGCSEMLSLLDTRMQTVSVP